MIILCYFHSIYKFCIIYRLQRGFFLKIFLIFTFKDANLADKFTNLAKKTYENLNSVEFMESVFSKSATD